MGLVDDQECGGGSAVWGDTYPPLSLWPRRWRLAECFDPIIISNWISDVRTNGITLPIHLGMLGVAPVHKLISISAQIGVRDSARFLFRHRGLFGRLTRQSTSSPDRLTMGLSEVIADPEANIEALHFYTFNQVGSCGA